MNHNDFFIPSPEDFAKALAANKRNFSDFQWNAIQRDIDRSKSIHVWGIPLHVMFNTTFNDEGGEDYTLLLKTETQPRLIKYKPGIVMVKAIDGIEIQFFTLVKGTAISVDIDMNVTPICGGLMHMDSARSFVNPAIINLEVKTSDDIAQCILEKSVKHLSKYVKGGDNGIN